MSANNRAREREQVRERNQQLKQLEKLQKKARAYESDLDNIYESLDEAYAKGETTKEQFDVLGLCKKNIGLDLVVFGKKAGITLGKRYITGKISKIEYDEIYEQIVPADVIAEKEKFTSTVAEMEAAINEFRGNCNTSVNNLCQHCGKKGTILNWLRRNGEYNLCGNCSLQYDEYRYFPGFKGKYFSADSIRNADSTGVKVNIQPEWL